jgi:hypothetical protein
MGHDSWPYADCHDNRANVPILQDEAAMQVRNVSASKKHHAVLVSMYTMPYYTYF